MSFLRGFLQINTAGYKDTIELALSIIKVSGWKKSRWTTYECSS
jgi:hypothetical protein